MLIEDLKTPLLLIALDNLTFSDPEEAKAVSIARANVLQKEIATLGSKKKQFDSSDLKNKIIRVPIPINDRLLPIHFVSSASRSTNIVDYFDNDALLHTGRNSVALSFEIKNSLSALSTIASLFLGFTGNRLFTSNEPRISFFSSNLAIFNAHLTGISRNTINNTDKEIITLALEVAPNTAEKESKIEKPAQTSGDLKIGAGIVPDIPRALPPSTPPSTRAGMPAPPPPPMPPPPPHPLRTKAQGAGIKGDDIDPLFSWYELFTVQEFNTFKIPDQQADFTIQRQSPRIIKTSTQWHDLKRETLTVVFNNTFLSLVDNEQLKIKDNYSLMIFDNRYYLGDKSA